MKENKKITIELSITDKGYKAEITEGTVDDLIFALLAGGREFNQIILDSFGSLLLNTERKEEILADVFGSMAEFKKSQMKQNKDSIELLGDLTKQLTNKIDC